MKFFKLFTYLLTAISVTGCSYFEELESSFISTLPTKESIEEILALNTSEPVIGIWQVEQGDDTWFQLAIVPNDENSQYQYKGVITNTGSLFNKGKRNGETFLYLSTVENGCWGIWKYSSYGDWKAIRFDFNETQGRIKDTTYYTPFQTVKISKNGLSSYPSSTPPAIQKAKETTSAVSAISTRGSGYGEISKITGRPKTVHVSGYHRKDGTCVKPHYRSSPRR